MGVYGPPVDQLLRIGNDFARCEADWKDCIALGIGPEHIPDLIRMADDDELFQAAGEGPELWAPFQAWRALGVLRAEEAIPTLVRIVGAEDRYDCIDWIIEELPTVFGMIGPAAIPELTGLLEREDARDRGRDYAALMLTGIAKRHESERTGIVATFARFLERAEWHESTLNAFVVCELLNLEAKEAAEVIERAYAGGFIDESIVGTWYRVWHELKIEGEPPPKPEGYIRSPHFPFALDHDQLIPNIIRTHEPIDDVEPSPSWQPADVKTPEARKDRNKIRAKLEKKGKGKGGKKR
jgi:hypothetical protein